MIFQTDFFGDPNVGIFGVANDKFCLIGEFVPQRDKIERSLEVKVLKISIANTNFVGIFCAMNSNGIILPCITLKREIEKVKKICKEFSMNLCILKTKYTALGNLIVCNDRGAIISKVFTKNQKKEIEECLDVEVVYGELARLNIIGSCSEATNRGCLLHRDASEDEIERFEDVLKVKCDVGTVNFGSPFVSSGIIANSNGAIVGNKTTGPEIARIMEVFELL